MKSFELDTAASREIVSATPERFAEKYGLTRESALHRINAISEMGKSAGIDSGMSREDINAVLSSDIYWAEVRQDEQEAYSLGIHAVPFFVVEGKYYISGAQSLEAMTCGADGCRI